MAKLMGMFISMTFRGVKTFEWQDPKTGVTTPIRNFSGLYEPGDGTRLPVEIGFPRDAPDYRPPALKIDDQVLFPVTVSLNKEKQVVQYTLRTDLAPMPAPDFK